LEYTTDTSRFQVILQVIVLIVRDQFLLVISRCYRCYNRSMMGNVKS